MSCSFCASNLHNIAHCNNTMIDILYERIKMIYINTMTQYPDEIEVMFKSVLNRSFNLRELRAVAVKYMNAFASATKRELVNVLWRYFSGRIHLPENDGWLEARRLPVEPDPIPEFARDLEQQQHDDESEVHDILWYIDQTPTLVLTLHELMRRDAELMLRDMAEINSRINRGHLVATNLLPEFEAVAHTPQVKKYNITPLLVPTEEEGVRECAICYENVTCIDMVKLNCSHIFCGSCIKGSLKAHNNIYCGPACALCRAPMTSFSVKNPEIYNLVSEHCL